MAKTHKIQVTLNEEHYERVVEIAARQGKKLAAVRDLEAPCATALRHAVDAGVELDPDSEVLQEILYRYGSIGRAATADQRMASRICTRASSSVSPGGWGQHRWRCDVPCRTSSGETWPSNQRDQPLDRI